MKADVVVDVIKVFRWTCPACKRYNVDQEPPEEGLLFCGCSQVCNIGDIVQSPAFKAAVATEQGCDSSEKP